MVVIREPKINTSGSSYLLLKLSLNSDSKKDGSGEEDASNLTIIIVIIIGAVLGGFFLALFLLLIIKVIRKRIKDNKVAKLK